MFCAGVYELHSSSWIHAQKCRCLSLYEGKVCGTLTSKCHSSDTWASPVLGLVVPNSVCGLELDKSWLQVTKLCETWKVSILISEGSLQAQGVFKWVVLLSADWFYKLKNSVHLFLVILRCIVSGCFFFNLMGHSFNFSSWIFKQNQLCGSIYDHFKENVHFWLENSVHSVIIEYLFYKS